MVPIENVVSDHIVDPKKVQRFLNLHALGVKFPPVIGVEDPFNYGTVQVVDGHHRFEMHRELGDTMIPMAVSNEPLANLIGKHTVAKWQRLKIDFITEVLPRLQRIFSPPRMPNAYRLEGRLPYLTPYDE